MKSVCVCVCSQVLLQLTGQWVLEGQADPWVLVVPYLHVVPSGPERTGWWGECGAEPPENQAEVKSRNVNQKWSLRFLYLQQNLVPLFHPGDLWCQEPPEEKGEKNHYYTKQRCVRFQEHLQKRAPGHPEIKLSTKS